MFHKSFKRSHNFLTDKRTITSTVSHFRSIGKSWACNSPSSRPEVTRISNYAWFKWYFHFHQQFIFLNEELWYLKICNKQTLTTSVRYKTDQNGGNLRTCRISNTNVSKRPYLKTYIFLIKHFKILKLLQKILLYI